MLSIIVAVSNQIGHNELFLEGIRRYTTGSYEVIVVDNHSTDGSAELFERQGCRVIRNDVNLCYPESMNSGIKVSNGDHLCLINNDVYVGPKWDELLIDAMRQFSLDAVSPLGIEQMPTTVLTDWMYDRWAMIGRGRLSSGKSTVQLRQMIRMMYGDWERFCAEIYQSFYPKLYEGVIGSCVILRRSLMEKIGPLDERIQAADWDLYYTIRQRELDVGDVHRIVVVGGAYVHHFIRATVKGKPKPFACTHPRFSIDEKWGREAQQRLWYKPEDFATYSPGQVSYNRMSRFLRKVKRETGKYWIYYFPAQPSHVLDMYREQFQIVE